MELTPSSPVAASECVIEFERSSQGRRCDSNSKNPIPGSGSHEPKILGDSVLLQITHQMRILVYLESSDFCKGIDGLTPLQSRIRNPTRTSPLRRRSCFMPMSLMINKSGLKYGLLAHGHKCLEP